MAQVSCVVDPAMFLIGGGVAGSFATFATELLRVKPSTAKGRYVKSVVVSSTMGPGVRVDSSVTRDFTA